MIETQIELLSEYGDKVTEKLKEVSGLLMLRDCLVKEINNLNPSEEEKAKMSEVLTKFQGL